MLALIRAIVGRDLRLALRRRSDIVSALFFFIIVVSLFPLGVGPEPELLRTLAPGVLWVAALLSTLLSLPRLFADDHRDGTLEQLALAPQPLGLIVLGKVFAHWLVSGLPLTLLAPVLGIQFDLSSEALWTLVISLLIGTPALSGIGAIGAALTLGVRGSGVLLSLLVLPLYIPVLIFGAGAVDAVVTGLGAQAHLSLLGALTLGGVFFAPWPTAAALRIALE
ncbi:heme exporter subunit; membrane component of ABC superfamily [Candidatus Propionivibrio aalborgensis]|uniref:Heme exporter protein B n=1 Tax=Candidatus Propionivibrio aalborgensis TaxID=1860101 RepID=A0A1A8XJW1_9RHOO|nr:heme exporter protein CcmB [Candidatus Propionivibrio aalborgensis]MBK7326510.1 heme exporter protein CcmB [Propionivibrio sp.]MBK7564250.1 heme exporter protein CcmB [Propionivibrio sp.]MBK9027069.1 heme exporter protein CcmB [Propionivibrio sp.]SBT04233.1 heme exporter subunit; membrane component of ABC superfamily [Candidatus Propionivibrio aalborgensis]HRC60077.1 heme exporter protein CcmB [Candidatus Propionivibrio aalborgensis]